MASDTILELTDDNFEQEVLKSDKPVLVDFWAEWCMPCRMLATTIDELAREFDGKVKVGKIDTEGNTKQSQLKFGIAAIPTVILFKDGQVVREFVGVQPKQVFAAELQKVSS